MWRCFRDYTHTRSPRPIAKAKERLSAPTMRLVIGVTRAGNTEGLGAGKRYPIRGGRAGIGLPVTIDRSMVLFE